MSEHTREELRRFYWFKLADDLGQQDDFLAMIEAERRDAVEMYKRGDEQKELLESVRRKAINDLLEARNPSHEF